MPFVVFCSILSPFNFGRSERFLRIVTATDRIKIVAGKKTIKIHKNMIWGRGIEVMTTLSYLEVKDTTEVVVSKRNKKFEMVKGDECLWGTSLDNSLYTLDKSLNEDDLNEDEFCVCSIHGAIQIVDNNNCDMSYCLLTKKYTILEY